MDNRDLIEVLRQNSSSFRSAPAVSGADLRALAIYHPGLPDEYVQFLKWSNGGELVAADQAVDLWDSATVVERNERLNVASRLPGHVLIGSNEGELAIAFACSSGFCRVVGVPFGDLSPDSVVELDHLLSKFVARVLAGEVDMEAL
ncbi:MAG TPA: SMI1/KNR4 family protein [Thermoanaerobaculia bacterium]